MIRIDEIYNNTFVPWIKKNKEGARVFYCDPPGRSDPDSLFNAGLNIDVENDYVFFHDQEPVHLDLHKPLFDAVIERNADIWAEPDGHVVVSEQGEFVDELCKKYGWHPHYYFYHGWACQDWFRGYDKTFLIPRARDRRPTKTFMSPNRIVAGKRDHRVLFLYNVFKNQLEHNYISAPRICPVEGVDITSIAQKYQHVYQDISTVFEQADLPRTFAGEETQEMTSCWLTNFDESADSLVYVPTETVYFGRRLHITEKTFKAIALEMPFVLVAPAGSLEYMRRYGFKTFSDVFDESYDEETDDIARIEKVTKLLKDLDNLTELERLEIHRKCLPIVEHNYNHFYNGGLTEILWEELNSMLNELKLAVKIPQFNFAVDRTAGDKIYPAFAQWQAEPYTEAWRQFAHHYPNTVPLELLEHCAAHSYPYSISLVGDNEEFAYYPVGLGFFNFGIDYFSLMPKHVIQRLKDKTLQVLFYYHEGDNPYRIQERLNQLCDEHDIDYDCYRFISGNTAADKIKGFIYFPDHELLYWRRNRRNAIRAINLKPRPYQFTLLSRTHKWPRATIIADLHRSKLLDRSLWSYNTIDVGDRLEDNPIELSRLPGLADYMHNSFLPNAPYRCDTMSDTEQNDHRLIEYSHFTDSYCHLVVETLFDADGSNGTFLTEKTFKPIKHGQPFIIIGPAGSLAQLRKLGYRTFDEQIDNSYDSIENNTNRWIAIKRTIEQLANKDMHEWFKSCLPDIEHNQQLFCSSKYPRLNNLLERLNEKL